MPAARRTNSTATAGLFFSSHWCFGTLGSTPARHGVSRCNPGEEVPTLRSEVFLPLPLLPTSCRLPRPAGPRMELRRGGVGSQAAGRRMDGDCRDGGCGSKDAGSEDYENLPTSASVSTHMTAGAMAGILEHSVMYPVDSVKVRLAEDCGGKGAWRAAAAARVCIPHSASLGQRREATLLVPPDAATGQESVRDWARAAWALGRELCLSFYAALGNVPRSRRRVPHCCIPPRSRGTSGKHSVRGGGCGIAPSDCRGAARARLPRELVAGKRSLSSS